MRERIPDDVWQELRRVIQPETGRWALPTSRTRAGTAGETWIVATDTRLLVADRTFGGPLTIQETPIRLIQRVTLGDGVLEIGEGHDVWERIAFGPLERADVERLAGVLRAPSAAAPLRTLPSPRDPAIAILPTRTSWRPGDVVEGVLRVVWPADGPVTRIGMRFYGAEQAASNVFRPELGDEVRWESFDEEAVWADVQEMPVEALAAEPVVLRAGVHDFPFRFPIPADATPTHHGPHISCSWTINARMHATGAGELSDRAVLPVLLQRREFPRPASRHEAAHGDLSMEVRLADGSLAPGGMLDAVVVVKGKPEGWTNVVYLDVERISVTRVKGQALRNEERMAQARISDWIDGAECPVRIPLPPDFVAPLSGRIFDVSHRIVAHIPFRGVRAEIPLFL